MAKENSDASTGFRLGLTFHRTFPLVRSAVVDILKGAYDLFPLLAEEV